MTNSHLDPKNREKTACSTVEPTEKLQDEQSVCIVKLERAIETLKNHDNPKIREKLDSTVKMLQWAADELRDTVPDTPIDPERIATINRLLRQYS